MKRRASWIIVILIAVAAQLPSGFAQDSATGAISGIVTDPSGASVAGARVSATNEGTAEVRTATSQSSGRYVFPLLSPGAYRVEVAANGFRNSVATSVHVVVTETTAANFSLVVQGSVQEVTVTGQSASLQTETSTQGQVITADVIQELPLVTRNFDQILALSPGVAANVFTAGGLGLGSNLMVAHGVSKNDNTYLVNGTDTTDIFSTNNIPIPNPDTIDEFKVQTSQYDASFGRGGGASVDLLTKGGSNNFHGSVFEFFRNTALNANDYFLKQAKQPRPVLRQNQFGFAFGGPIKKDKLLFFTSYQGTRQANGVGFGCASTITSPPLTSNRSAAALGALFAGQTGVNGGTPIKADGSNISSAALALLQLKLPNGNFLFPTPQIVNPALPFLSQGLSAFSQACTFTEDQYMGNADYVLSDKSKISLRSFVANDQSNLSLSGAQIGGPSVPGFPGFQINRFRTISLGHTYVFSSNLLNHLQFSFNRTYEDADQKNPFSFSDVGIQVPAFDNPYPEIAISGNYTLGGQGSGFTISEYSYQLQDSVSWVHGRHALRMGGGVAHYLDNLDQFHFIGGLTFLSFPDFLLGQSAGANGSAVSNVFSVSDQPGLTPRHWRVWNWNTYLQDDFKATRRFTLNMGFRYEHLGDPADALGRDSIFNTALANPNPPASGTLAGYVVQSNFPGTLPPGVSSSGNELAINGTGQDTFAPRLGFAWLLPGTERLALRGGYGIYYSQITQAPFLLLTSNPPFGIFRSFSGSSNAASSLVNPFPVAPPTFPFFVPYSPTTNLSTISFDPNIEPPMIQQYNLNLQAEVARNLVLEVGFEGAHATREIRQLSVNQAMLATAANPIRGQTTNTLSNIAQRVPIEGWAPNALTQVESQGYSWYDGLNVTARRQFATHLQFAATYTYLKDLTTDTGISTGDNGGIGRGNQDSDAARYGPNTFIRPHRFVISYEYSFPEPAIASRYIHKALEGWKISGVTVLQSGQPLAITGSNSKNIFGIASDRGEISGQCSPSQFVTSGAVTDKLSNYFNKSCFTNKYPVIGDDGIATAFGNAPIGAVRGPDQRNWDIAILKDTRTGWPNETANLQFRAEFFNAFNTPSFANPIASTTSSAFGLVTSTTTSPRIIQFALKYSF